MILTSTKDGCLGIPCKGISEVVNIVPGSSEIDDKFWVLARDNAKRLIDSGVITEEWKKVEIGESRDLPLVLETGVASENNKRLIPSKITDIDRKGQGIFKIVKGTYHIPSLEKWLDEDSREDVRIAMHKQLEGVKSGDIKG